MTTWQPAPARPQIAGHSVHLWLAKLQDFPGQYNDKLLSEAERQRAARFRFPTLRQYYVAAHVLLRTILAGCTQTSAEALQFMTNPYGKPYLPDSKLQFNMSHSGDYALVAVALETAVGIDIEKMKPEADLEALAQQVFSLHERQALHALPVSQRTQGFFNCWTRKEAYIKAIGKGLSQPLDQFDVSMEPDQPARLLHIEGEPKGRSRWSMYALPAPPGYAAALVVEGQKHDLHFWRFDPT